MFQGHIEQACIIPFARLVRGRTIPKESLKDADSLSYFAVKASSRRESAIASNRLIPENFR